eukprot:1153302-Pelagomonas_calceolata.AAC.2
MSHFACMSCYSIRTSSSIWWCAQIAFSYLNPQCHATASGPPRAFGGVHNLNPADQTSRCQKLTVEGQSFDFGPEHPCLGEFTDMAFLKGWKDGTGLAICLPSCCTATAECLSNPQTCALYKAALDFLLQGTRALWQQLEQTQDKDLKSIDASMPFYVSKIP